jgi:hypothetical protein
MGVFFMSDGEEKEWYTSGEAAEYLGIPLARLAHLRRTKRIKGITGGGKNTRYAMYHIDELRKVDSHDQRLKQPKSDDEVA